MEALGAAADARARVYFTGGATAVLLGWRPSTIDIDLKLVPEHDALLRAIPRRRTSFPSRPDGRTGARSWPTRGGSPYYHFDLYAQALAKVERGHAQDLGDVRELLARKLIEPARALEYFDRIEPELYRFPALHGPSFRRAVEEVFGKPGVG